MQVVIRYAKRGKDDKETIREVIRDIPTRNLGTQTWHEFVATATFLQGEGERIVAIIEGGYH